MSKKNYNILMLTTTLALIALVSNMPAVSAEERAWQVGDLITFSNQEFYYAKQTDATYDVIYEFEQLNQEKGSVNITGINLLTGYYSYIYKNYFGTYPLTSDPFKMSQYVSDYLDINSLLSVTYEWDYGTNTSILVDFEFNFPVWKLIEPDWSIMNEALIDVFNESQVIFVLADPYDPIIYNFTLSDFLNDISFTLMGKKTLTEAKLLFKPTTHKWDISFDLSDKIFYSEFNSSLGYNIYYPYEKYTHTYLLSYEKGGVLSRASEELSLRITVEKLIAEIAYNRIMVKGDLEALTVGFPYYIIVPGIMSIILAVRIVYKKSNGVTR